MRARFTIVPTQGMAALPDSPRVKQTNSRPGHPPAKWRAQACAVIPGIAPVHCPGHIHLHGHPHCFSNYKAMRYIFVYTLG